VTDQKRIELMCRCVVLVRAQIEANGGRYDGGAFAPNLQSVIDLGTVDEALLADVEDRLILLEAEAACRPEGP
jgi:hypothetical protein